MHTALLYNVYYVCIYTDLLPCYIITLSMLIVSPSLFIPLPPSPLSVTPSLSPPFFSLHHSDGTWGGDTVIQGIICLIGAISHPVLLCQTAVFLWSLPVFTVACRGRALAGTEGLSTQPRRVFQSLSGVLGLISRGSFSLSLVPPASPYCSFDRACCRPCSQTDEAN